MKKTAIFLFAFLFQLSVIAETAPTIATGAVFYKMKSGKLVQREVTLEVPAKGKGEIVLKYGGKEARTSDFRMIKAPANRDVFEIVFIDPPGSPKNSVGLFRGSLLKGTGNAIYYGDFFGKTYQPEKKAELAKEIFAKGEEGMTYYGGFGFQAKIDE